VEAQYADFIVIFYRSDITYVVALKVRQFNNDYKPHFWRDRGGSEAVIFAPLGVANKQIPSSQKLPLPK